MTITQEKPRDIMLYNVKRLDNDTDLDFIKYEKYYSVMCSIGKKPFCGMIEILYRPLEYLLEFMSFDEWIDGMANSEFTVENFCDHIGNELFFYLEPKELSVTVTASTIVHGNVTARYYAKYTQGEGDEQES